MDKSGYFLSIDMDFFNPIVTEIGLKRGYSSGDFFTCLSVNYPVYGWLCNMYRYAMDMGIRVTAVTNHQQMLGAVNKSKSRFLLNLDYHNDIVVSPCRRLHCGNWVNYVDWRSEGEYIWWHLNNTFDGACEPSVFGDRLLVDADGTSWGKFSHRKLRWMPRLWNTQWSVSEICVCASPGFSHLSCLDAFCNLVKRYNIYFKRGLLSERHSKVSYAR